MRGLILALLPSAAAAFTHADRHAHHLAAAGLDRHGRTAGADSPKCVEGQHTAGCQGYPKDSPGIFFSGTFTDNAVLQREAKSAVYGVVVGATASTKVSVSMSGSADDGSVLAAAPIPATVDMSTSAAFGYARWKATLPEQKAGGNYSITAACAGKCGNQSSVTISDVGSPPHPIRPAHRSPPVPPTAAALKPRSAQVTFGDVWFCSGQSNMWLVMHFDTSRNVTYDKIMQGKYSNIRKHLTCCPL